MNVERSWKRHLNIVFFLYCTLFFGVISNASANSDLYFLKLSKKINSSDYELLQLSEGWSQNNEQELNQLKKIRDLSLERVVPLKVAFKNNSSQKIVQSVSVFPEFSSRVPMPERKIEKIVLTENGVSVVNTCHSGGFSACSMGVMTTLDQAIEILKIELKSPLHYSADQVEYFFYRLAEATLRSGEKKYALFVKEKWSDSEFQRFPLSEGFVKSVGGQDRMKLLRQMNDLAKDDLMIPLDLGLYPEAVNGKQEILRVSIRGRDLANTKLSITLSSGVAIATDATGADTEPFRAWEELAKILPTQCGLDLNP